MKKRDEGGLQPIGAIRLPYYCYADYDGQDEHFRRPIASIGSEVRGSKARFEATLACGHSTNIHFNPIKGKTIPTSRQLERRKRSPEFCIVCQYADAVERGRKIVIYRLDDPELSAAASAWSLNKDRVGIMLREWPEWTRYHLSPFWNFDLKAYRVDGRRVWIDIDQTMAYHPKDCAHYGLKLP